ncbi:MAG: nucleoside deaminase [Alphaproteobacteria bacterium]|nr:nucleoside deaminase [Alphaproteobacteria bacterium]
MIADIRLPGWTAGLARPAAPAADLDCMSFVLELARGNVSLATGGPFAAALRDDATGAVAAIGVNLVLPQRCAVLHAEVVALLMSAGKGPEPAGMTLFSSCEPCIMCMGALHWSGVRRIVYSALREDAEAIGFSEGAGVVELKAQMTARGVVFDPGLLRAQGIDILRAYKARGAVIYGPGK